jgi:diguanylate cyclase (GGDEF)-like protein
MQIRMTGLELKAIALVVAVAGLVLANAWALHQDSAPLGQAERAGSQRIVHLSELLAAASALPSSIPASARRPQAGALEASLLRARAALKRLLADYQYDGATFAKLSAIDDGIVGWLADLRRGTAGGEPRAEGDLDTASVTRIALDLLGSEQQRLERGQSATAVGTLGSVWFVVQAAISALILVLAFLTVRDARAWRRRAEKPDAAKFMEPGQTIADRRALVAGIQTSIVSSLNRSRTIGLMYVELGNLGAIRQKLGWDSADRVVTDIAEMLRSEFRRSDLVARLEGDVMVVMASDISARADLEGIATRIRKVLDKFAISALPDVRIAAEIGSAMYPIDGYSAEDMLAAARNSLLERKTIEGSVVLADSPAPQPA